MRGNIHFPVALGPNPYELGISGGANQLAAMRSLHIGWALLVAHYWTDAIVAIVRTAWRFMPAGSPGVAQVTRPREIKRRMRPIRSGPLAGTGISRPTYLSS